MRILVLSGGGAKGAYQVGVLSRWLGEEKKEYDAFCGVSVGALNTSWLAQYGPGQALQSYDDLKALWEGITTASVYRKWPFVGELGGLFHPSIYDSSPLKSLVRSRLNVDAIRKSGKKLRVGATDLASGKYRVFGEDYRFLAEAVLASASYPVALLPIWMEGSRWTDGGVRTVTPIQAAVDLGATEIDVVMCSAKEEGVTLPAKPNAIWVAQRSIDLMSDQIIEDDFNAVSKVNKLVMAGMKLPWWTSARREISMRLVRPRTGVGDSLDFSPAKIQAMMAKGREDALHPTDGL